MEDFLHSPKKSARHMLEEDDLLELIPSQLHTVRLSLDDVRHWMIINLHYYQWMTDPLKGNGYAKEIEDIEKMK